MIEELKKKNLVEKDFSVLAKNTREIANYYRLLFQIQKAKEYANKSLSFANKSGDPSELLFSKLTLANIYFTDEHPDTALVITENSASLLNLITEKKERSFATAYYYLIKGIMLNANYKIDSSIIYFDKGIALANKQSDDPEDIKLLCSLYSGKALPLVKKRKKDEAVKLTIQAVKLAENFNEEINLMLVYFKYGSILGKNEDDIKYLLKAGEIAQRLELKGMQGEIYDHTGSNYYDKGEFKLAYKYANESVQLKKKYTPVNSYIQSLGNFSQALIKLDSLDRAEEIIRETIKLQDISILTYDNFSSLVQLSEVLHLRGRYEEQREIINIAEKLAETSKIEDCIITFQQQKMNYYQATGNYEGAFTLLNKITLYYDSIAEIKSHQKLEELNIQYETEKKDNEIILLNAQQEISNTKLSRQRIAIISSSALAILFGITGFALFKRIQLKRKTDLKIEKLERLNEIQQLRTNIALDMHDDIGASLSSIRLYSEVVKTQAEEKLPEAGKMLKKISENAKEIVENMSDIVWAINPKYDEIKNLQSRMRSFATDLCAANNIIPDFIWDETAQLDIPMEKRRNIYLIFKEAVNNAVKYAECKKIIIRLKEQQNILMLEVSDDGKGFVVESSGEESMINQGNGLKNMKFRAKEINGNVEIISKIGEGTSVIFKMHIT
ncbi:MAG: hypothetical protein H7Y00_05045 [Fimbriimonadaceae bacterium]|nr:hypothetical protein [Chitinophagales bacterium]